MATVLVDYENVCMKMAWLELLTLILVILCTFSAAQCAKSFLITIRGAKASAVIYSIVETARLNNLSSYYYVDHLLTELPKLRDENGNIDTASLDQLLPWSETLPDNCRKPRRK